MTSEQIAEITEIIETQIVELKKEIIELKELTKPIPLESSIGRISRMDAINNKTVNEAALRAASAKLEKLENILPQIGGDRYGKCFRCKDLIPFERLKYMPESFTCVSCAG